MMQHCVDTPMMSSFMLEASQGGVSCIGLSRSYVEAGAALEFYRPFYWWPHAECMPAGLHMWRALWLLVCCSQPLMRASTLGQHASAFMLSG